MAELTREELLILLHKKDNQESKTLKCIYKPVRGVHKECLEKVSTPYGFCKKHSRTVQARKARQELETPETETTSVVATQEVVTPVAAAPEVVTPVETPVKAPVEAPVETSIEEVVGEIEETLLPSREVHRAPRKAAPKPTRRKAAPKPVRRKAAPKTIRRKAAPKSARRKAAPKPVRRKAPKKTRKKYITPNIWGRYEDTDTHICFDAETHSAYGVQSKNGELIALGPREIAICEKNRWKYETVEEDSSESDFSEEDLNSYESEGDSEGEFESESEGESDSYSEEASEEDSDSEGESEEEEEEVSEKASDSKEDSEEVSEEASEEESDSEGDSGGEYLSRSESSDSESEGEYYY